MRMLLQRRLIRYTEKGTTMTTLIFVRHGQSESNLACRFTGQGNACLTPLGIEQAERTARYLKDEHIDAIYSSDLLRSMQTAEPTARMHGLEIIPDPALREIDAGEWEGQLYEDLRTNDAQAFERWFRDTGHARPTGGESTAELAERVNAEVERIVRAHRGQCVAIFTHATPIRAMGCRWFGNPIEKMADTPWAPNASVSVIEYADSGEIHIVKYGYDAHQGECSTVLPRDLV